jgi:hypothetical protein
MEFQSCIQNHALNLWLHNVAIVIHHSPLPLGVRIQATVDLYTDLLLFFAPLSLSLPVHTSSFGTEKKMDRSKGTPTTGGNIHEKDDRTSLLSSLEYYFTNNKTLYECKNDKIKQNLLQGIIESCIITDSGNLTIYLQKIIDNDNHPITLAMTNTKRIWTKEAQAKLHERHNHMIRIEKTPSNYCLILLHIFHVLLLLYEPTIKLRKHYLMLFQHILFPIILQSMNITCQNDILQWWQTTMGQQSSTCPVFYNTLVASSALSNTHKFRKATTSLYKHEIYEWLMHTCNLLHITNLTTVSQIRRTLYLFIVLWNHQQSSY